MRLASVAMARVGVMGGGAFGTAMACVVRRSGHDVTLWAREAEVVEAINDSGTNPLFLANVQLVPGIRATPNVLEAASDRDFILMAVPAQHMRAVAAAMAPAVRRGTPVVSCSKGIEVGSLALMPEVLADTLPGAVIAVLSGPSFAREIANDLPCGVVVACEDWAVCEGLGRAISNPRFCVHLSDDVVGTTLGGVMKNVVSIASGIAAGQKLGDNARATICTLGLLEAQRLGVARGAKAETFLALAGAGDFMLTAHSLASRNTSLGFALGEGRRLEDVLAERREVTEGAHNVGAIAALARQLHVAMPVTLALDGLLNRGLTLEAATEQLMRHLPVLCRAG